ncbi:MULTISPECIES: DMT family transporter [unclassified Paracoccus (in: a-proteobacteria)]|uniref:DMT family transporter n=1 Tax=unclassified Paracoccus (in: a-proteobacteria) TaxID=2688777 RepID=UPI001FFDF6DC|nr:MULTISPECIES: DMT family transporter [unclassified Paracoccus (in: a-proteobacteria)]
MARINEDSPADRLTRQGMVAMVAATLLLPVGDALSKLLTGIVPPFDVTAWRTVMQAMFLIPVAILLRNRLTGAVFSWPALLSGALISAAMFSLISAFQQMPIATAIAIFFIEPLLLTLLAAPLLGEVPGRRRLIAVGIGLIGALIVIRPNLATFGPVALWPLGAALAFALNMIVLRKATRTRSALSVQIGATISAALLLIGVQVLAGVAFDRAIPNPFDLPAWAVGALLAAGALAAFTFVLIAVAFSKAEAGVLAPFQYLEIVGATIVGYLVFGDLPDALTWLGTAIILGAGMYVFYRERQSGRGLTGQQSS